MSILDPWNALFAVCFVIYVVTRGKFARQTKNNETVVQRRHPMYVAIFLVCLAQGLMLDNWLAGWAAFVAFACLYIRRAPIEEQMLTEQFGEQYDAYRRKTCRLVPKIY